MKGNRLTRDGRRQADNTIGLIGTVWQPLGDCLRPHMARHSSVGNQPYRAAHTSNGVRAASRGPGAHAKGQGRRHAGRVSGGFARSVLRALKLRK
jgi:hypothetical protein